LHGTVVDVVGIVVLELTVSVDDDVDESTTVLDVSLVSVDSSVGGSVASVGASVDEDGSTESSLAVTTCEW
jgi:hypothetical protein